MKTALRLPRDLHSRLMEAAIERGHSLNAEMVRRLDGSFSGPVQKSEIDRLLQRLDERDDKAAKLESQNRLLSLSAILMRFLIQRLPPSDDQIADRMMTLAKDYSDCLVHGRTQTALYKAVELMEMGVRAGVFSEMEAASASQEPVEHQSTKQPRA